MKVIFNREMSGLIYGLTIRTVDGVIVFGANTRNRGMHMIARREGEIAWICFKLDLNLLPGEYFLSLGIAQDDDTVDNLAIDSFIPCRAFVAAAAAILAPIAILETEGIFYLLFNLLLYNG